ncbi:MAG: terminase small subunit [Burkholderiales bacterium]|nr:terminase small subunit [Burkholderiales bacterium]
MNDADRPLTPKQRKFVEEYSLSGKAGAAAVEAGYAEKSAKVSASRMLRSRRVQEALAARGADARAKFNLTRDGLVKELLCAVDLARERGDPMAMVAAARELGRLCGFYPAT